MQTRLIVQEGVCSVPEAVTFKVRLVVKWPLLTGF